MSSTPWWQQFWRFRQRRDLPEQQPLPQPQPPTAFDRLAQGSVPSSPALPLPAFDASPWLSLFGQGLNAANEAVKPYNDMPFLQGPIQLAQDVGANFARSAAETLWGASRAKDLGGMDAGVEEYRNLRGPEFQTPGFGAPSTPIIEPATRRIDPQGFIETALNPVNLVGGGVPAKRLATSAAEDLAGGATGLARETGRVAERAAPAVKRLAAEEAGSVRLPGKGVEPPNPDAAQRFRALVDDAIARQKEAVSPGAESVAAKGVVEPTVPTGQAMAPQEVNPAAPLSEAASLPPAPPIEPPTVGTAAGKERGFVTHTVESPIGSPLLRDLINEDPVTYSPITNKGTMEAAVKSVDTDPVAARVNLMADVPLDPDTMVDTMAQGIVLMRRAANGGDTKEIYTLSRRIAERLTSSAQSVQLASTIDNLTPEGLFVYINRVIGKAVGEGKGGQVAGRIRQATQREAIKRETKAAEDAVVEAERKVAQVRQRGKNAADPLSNQRASDLEYLIDDSVREIKATLTPADRQAIIKAKAILKQSVAEMDVATANSFLDRAAELGALSGEERVQALIDLVEEVRQLPDVLVGNVEGKSIKPSVRLLKEQAADLVQLVDRTSRNIFQQLNSVDRLAIARVKAILKRTDVELPQGMAEELLADARSLRGLPKAEQPAALAKLSEKIKQYDPVAKELARKKLVADAEARARQSARQSANDLTALIDASSRKAGTKGITAADRQAIGKAKGILTKHGAEMPEDMARDFLERARALNDLPGAEQASAVRALVDEVNNFNPVKESRLRQQSARDSAAAAKQRAKDLEYLAHQELRTAKTRLKNVERDAIRSAKSKLKDTGVEMPEELAQSFLDRAKALQSITDEYDQMRAAQSLMKDVHNLLPPSKWDTFLNAIGIPRALKSMWDDSFLMRQGIFQFWGHNTEWRDAMSASLGALKSREAAILADRQFFARPFYKPLKEAGLEYVDLMGGAAQREETFMTSWAQRIPGARQSESAFTVAGNKLRGGTADSVVSGWLPNEIQAQVESGQRVFSNLDELIQVTGRSKQDFVRLAQWANATSGRGNMANFLKLNNQWLNALFFAPRFAISRFEVPYLATRIAIENPALRSTVAKDLGGFIAGSATVLLVMDQVPGVEVEWDSNSSDFGKIRYGALSIDFLGGYAPLVRYVSQVITGQRKSRGGAIQDVNRLEVLLGDFLGGKLSPAASEVVDTLRGQDTLGNKIDTTESRLQRIAKDFIPFLPQDVIEAWKEMGIVGAAVAAPTSFFGGSINAYTTISDKFDAVAKNATGGKVEHWQDLPAAERLKLESSPEVQALLEEGQGRIPMQLRKYVEPKEYQAWKQATEAGAKLYATMPALAKIGLNPGQVGDSIDNVKLSLSERTRYQEIATEELAKFLPKALKDPAYIAAKTDARRKEIVQSWGRDAMESARDRVWQELKLSRRQKEAAQ